jgi:hypothetical protein
VQSRARRQKRSTVRWASTRAQETLSLGRCATPMMFRSLINAPKYLLLRVLNWWSGCGGATACKYMSYFQQSRGSGVDNVTCRIFSPLCRPIALHIVSSDHGSRCPAMIPAALSLNKRAQSIFGLGRVPATSCGLASPKSKDPSCCSHHLSSLVAHQ